nr:MAG TPA: hypothetical protein [Caudoviricetes sp.]
MRCSWYAERISASDAEGAPYGASFFFYRKLKKTIDRFYALAYNIKCQGEMEIPENKRGGKQK